MLQNMNIPRHLREKVKRELSGEMIRWIDMPIPRFFTLASTSAFLFAIPWTTFAIFWVCAASGCQIPDFKNGLDLFPLFGVPFILIGIGMLSSPLYVYWKALTTVYVITNKRAITFDGGWSTTIQSYFPENLKEIYRKERRNGTGDVIITRRSWRDSDDRQQIEELGFWRIKNPKNVEQMLKTLS